MKEFFKKISLVLAVSLGVFLFANTGLAQTQSKYGTAETAEAAGLEKNVAGATSVEELIGSIVNIVLSLIGIIFFVLIFYAGFTWMTARGNSEKIDKAKEMIESAAIGIIVILAAYAITNFIFTELSKNSAGGTNPDQACLDAGGGCGTPASCTAGTIRTGLCSGGADNVCCVP